MMPILFFLFGLASAWRGFSTHQFGYLVLAVVLWLFMFASFGMTDEPMHTTQPPSTPPGQKRRHE